MRLTHGIRILLVDGSRMRLLENTGDESRPHLETLLQRHADVPANRALHAGPPGLTLSRGHPGRSSLDEGDPHQQHEDRFVRESLEMVEAAGTPPDKGLVVVAPPRALAVLRDHYAADTRSILLAEIAKDLGKHTAEDVARIVSQADEPDGNPARQA